MNRERKKVNLKIKRENIFRLNCAIQKLSWCKMYQTKSASISLWFLGQSPSAAPQWRIALMEKQNSSSIHYPDAGRGEGGGERGQKGRERSSRPVQRGRERGEIMEGGRRRGRIMEEGRRRPKTTQQCRLPVIDEGGRGGRGGSWVAEPWASPARWLVGSGGTRKWRRYDWRAACDALEMYFWFNNRGCMCMWALLSSRG